MVNQIFRNRLLAAAALGAALSASPAFAQEKAGLAFNVAAQDLAGALKAVAEQAGRQIVFPAGAVDGKRSAPLRGVYTPEDAVRALIAGTGLVAEFKGDAILVRGRSDGPGDLADAPAVESEVTVTGSRIRGAPSASPVIRLTQRQMLDAGHNSLVDVVRAIPQNFSGGQNPGIGPLVPASGGVNVGGASSINLRGLGSDATLTLLNGHRLSYSASRQSVDVSVIPLAAVDRLEVVADGASAIYGSDAVAGVANMILKSDYDGLGASARFGASTDGGNVQQQYSLVGGKSWASGGFIAAYEFENDTAVGAAERSYARRVAPGLTLYPALKHHNAILSGHLALADDLTVRLDGLYNDRRSRSSFAFTAAGDVDVSGSTTRSESESFVIAPSISLALSRDWHVSLSAMYGRDHAFSDTRQVLGGVLRAAVRGCYCNRGQSVEATGDGTLFALPGGAARVAFGAGYRSNKLLVTNSTAADIKASQDSYYGFGELSLPIASPELAIPGLYRLNLSGAVRYEDYPGIDQIATPRIGLVYAPIPAIEIKGSWGKSFRAPTLFQQYNIQGSSVYAASARGGTGYRPTASILQLEGGNPAVKPERATTWSATLVARPLGATGPRIEVSYFSIAYRDRIVAPVTFPTQALSNAAYAQYIKLNPTIAEVEAAVAGTTMFATGRPYVPADIVAIVNNVSTNAARQDVEGVDGLIDWPITLAGNGSLTLQASGSYMKSTQRLSPLQPETPLSGRIFNPPQYRGRAGAIWNSGPTTLSAFVTYTGGVDDVRTAQVKPLGAMTTIDLTGRHRLDTAASLLRNVELSVSIQNLTNAKPTQLTNTLVYETPYDSTNYAPLGRVVSLTLAKRW